MIRVKICGITNVDDALMSVECGADAVGFVFAPGGRMVSVRKAANIVKRLPPFVQSVGVFVNPDEDEVEKTAAACGLDRVQFHGGVSSSCLQRFGCKAVRVFDVYGEKTIHEIRKEARPFFMLDLPKGQNRKGPIDPVLVRKASKWGKVILAGGLSPENLPRVLAGCLPYAVDVCRGVERETGKKCPQRLKHFISKVKTWNMNML